MFDTVEMPARNRLVSIIMLLTLLVSCGSQTTLISNSNINIEFHIPSEWNVLSETDESMSIIYTENGQDLLQIDIDSLPPAEGTPAQDVYMVEFLNSYIETISQGYEPDAFVLAEVPHFIKVGSLSGAKAEIYVQDTLQIAEFTATFIAVPCSGDVILFEAMELGTPTQFASELAALTSSINCLD